ncbi:MAG: formate dehydrogenase major subunit, partial [Massilia sp.]
MNAPIHTVSFELNGRAVEALPHETLIEVADREGVAIPRLCYKEGFDAVGNCRSCMVEIDGERVLAPSCCRNPTPGMKVKTDSPRAVAAQKMVLELLQADMPEAEYTRKNEVDLWAEKLGLGRSRFTSTRRQPQVDASHAAMTVNLDACIQCTRCVRACRDEQVNDVIGLAFRGENAKIVFDQDDPMGASTCV